MPPQRRRRLAWSMGQPTSPPHRSIIYCSVGSSSAPCLPCDSRPVLPDEFFNKPLTPPITQSIRTTPPGRAGVAGLGEAAQDCYSEGKCCLQHDLPDHGKLGAVEGAQPQAGSRSQQRRAEAKPALNCAKLRQRENRILHRFMLVGKTPGQSHRDPGSGPRLHRKVTTRPRGDVAIMPVQGKRGDVAIMPVIPWVTRPQHVHWFSRQEETFARGGGYQRRPPLGGMAAPLRRAFFERLRGGPRHQRRRFHYPAGRQPDPPPP